MPADKIRTVRLPALPETKLDKLASRAEKLGTSLRQAQTKLRDLQNEPEPLRPYSVTPSVSENIAKVAQAMSMCPHELTALVKHEIDTSDVLVMTAFKNYITTLKLSGNVDLHAVQVDLKKRRETDAARQAFYEGEVQSRNNGISEAQAKFDNAQAKMSKLWKSKLDSLESAISAHNAGTKKLSGDHLYLFKALRISTVRGTMVQKRNGTFYMNRKSLDSVSLFEIEDLLAEGHSVVVEEFRDKMGKVLDDLDLAELRNLLERDLNSEQRNIIESEIKIQVARDRYNRAPIRDRYESYYGRNGPYELEW